MKIQKNLFESMVSQVSDTFSSSFIDESINILRNLDFKKIEKIAIELSTLRKNKGRLFVCGVGGSAAHASHATCDFRKISEIDAICPTDNVSELTARVNDEGWESFFENYISVSNLNSKDAIFILSVGGGSEDPPVSINLINIIKFAKKKNVKVFGIVGKEEGYASVNGDCVLNIPNLFPTHLTPHTEGISSIIWHLLVSHPVLKINKTKW
jgi:D-sedoheptulose 7-phosphate isomerase